MKKNIKIDTNKTTIFSVLEIAILFIFHLAKENFKTCICHVLLKKNVF